MTDTERTRAVLVKLDELAQRDDPHDYGLPLHNPGIGPLLQDTILAAFAEVREECAKIADHIAQARIEEANRLKGRESTSELYVRFGEAEYIAAAIRAHGEREEGR